MICSLRMRLRSLSARLQFLRSRLSIPSAQLRAALLLAWLVISAGLGAVATAALAMPDEAVLAAAARCEAPGGHRGACALCGMTHAFLSLREGDLRGAMQANAGSVALFPALALNEALAVFVLMRRMKMGWQSRVRFPVAVRHPGQ